MCMTREQTGVLFPAARRARGRGTPLSPQSRGCGEWGMERSRCSCPVRGREWDVVRGECLARAMKSLARGGEWLSRGGECGAKAMKCPVRSRECLLADGE